MCNIMTEDADDTISLYVDLLMYKVRCKLKLTSLYVAFSPTWNIKATDGHFVLTL